MLNKDSSTSTSGSSGATINTESLVGSTVARGGKMLQIFGWIFIVLSIPLMLVIVGFILLPAGIAMVWYGKKLSRDAGQLAKKTTQGMAAVGRTFGGRE